MSDHRKATPTPHPPPADVYASDRAVSPRPLLRPEVQFGGANQLVSVAQQRKPRRMRQIVDRTDRRSRAHRQSNLLHTRIADSSSWPSSAGCSEHCLAPVLSEQRERVASGGVLACALHERRHAGRENVGLWERDAVGGWHDD